MEVRLDTLLSRSGQMKPQNQTTCGPGASAGPLHMNRDTLAGSSCPSSLAPADATTALQEIERPCDVVARQAGTYFLNLVMLGLAFASRTTSVYARRC